MSAVLTALKLRCLRNGGAIVLRGGDRDLSLAETLRHIDTVANRLAQAPIRTLAISADNSPDWVIADLAAQRAGIPVVPLPPYFSPDQVEHILADSGADAIVADEPGSVSLLSLPTRFAGELTPRLALLDVDSTRGWANLHPGTAKVSYTSGTTGTPKGVCLTQDTMDWVAGGLHEAMRDIGIERHLCLLPLATLLENIAGVYAPILAGAELALPSLDDTGLLGATGLDVGRLLECIDYFKPQSVILLPQMLAGLAGAVEQGARLPESLRFAAVGGGVVGKPLLDRADQAGIPVFEGYGLTECGSVVALNTPRSRRPGSVGRPLAHCKVRIGRNSEVMVGGAVMSGYLGESRSYTREIATGDIGYIDDDGYLYISGRKTNVLITSFGRNLSPEWVEAALMASVSISQAALFGDGKPWNVAIIVPAPDASIDAIERDIQESNRRLPDYARVRRWVLAEEPFSSSNRTLTENGRLRRAVIHHRYEQEIEACYAGPIESYA